MTRSRWERVVRRRGWVIVLAGLAGLLGAFLVSASQSSSYTAGSTLLVSTGDPFNSARLASTYADALPEDGGLLRSIAGALSIDEEEVTESFSVTADTDTAVVRFEYVAPSQQKALRGAAAAVEAVTGRSPDASSVPAEALEVIRQPRITSSPASGASYVGPAVGLLLGLFLGAVLAVGLERSDPRLDSSEDLMRILQGTPVTELQRDQKALPTALLERWKELAQSTAPLVAMICTRGVNTRAITRLVGTAAEDEHREPAPTRAPAGTRPAEATVASGEVRVVSPADLHPADSASGLTVSVGGPPGTDGQAEMMVQQTDMTVVVVRRGSRERDLESDLTLLAQYGAKPSWGLLTS